MEPENLNQPIQPVAPMPAQTPPFVPPQPAPVQPPPQSEPQSKSSFPKWILLILGILLVLLLLGGGFFVLSKKAAKPSPTPTPVVTKAPTPTPDPTAGWKSYSGNAFSIKYPASLFLSPGTQSIVLSDSQIPQNSNQVINVNVFQGATPTASPNSPDNVYINNPNGGYASIQGKNVDPKTFNLIVSTFKFRDSTAEKVDTAITDKDNLKTINVKNDSTFSVTLRAFDDGEFVYENPVFDNGVILLSNTSKILSPAQGVDGQNVWVFKAVNTGTTKLDFPIWQPSIKSTEKIQDSFIINVQ